MIGSLASMRSKSGMRANPAFARFGDLEQAKIGRLRGEHLSQLVPHRVGVQIVTGKGGQMLAKERR